MSELTHIDESGKARMVDVSEKPVTKREARAQAIVNMQPETVQTIRDNLLAKGDALATARIAGILAAKNVDQMIPLCHTLPISKADIEFEIGINQIIIKAHVITIAQTGIEMEALSAVTTAALTIYDMAKAIDKQMVISDIHLLSKTGGMSGDFIWTNQK